MKIGKIILAVLVLAVLGAFTALLFIDVPVKQTEVSKEIPYDHAGP